MEIREFPSDGNIILELHGRFDAISADQVKEKLLAALTPNTGRLVVDCAHLKFITSIGLRVFMIAAKQAAGRNVKFQLCCVPEVVQQVLDLAGFASIVTIVPTREDALK